MSSRFEASLRTRAIALLVALLTLPVAAAGASAPGPHQGAGSSSAAPAAGQEGARPAGAVAAEEIRKRLDALKALENPTDEDKALIERLAQALELIGRAETSRKLAAERRELVAQLDTRLDRIRGQQPAPPTVPDGGTMEQLDQALKVATAEAAAARDALSQVDAQQAQLVERRRSLPDELAKARTLLGEAQLKAEKQTQGGGGDPAAQLTLAVLDDRTATVLALEAELDSLDAQQELVEAQRSVAQRRLDGADAAVRKIRDGLDSLHRERAEKAQETVRSQGSDGTPADPRISRLAAKNALLAERQVAVAALLKELTDEHTRREKELERLERDFSTDQERSRVAGASGQLSDLLRRQRQALPSTRDLAADAARLRRMRAEIDLERIDRTIEHESLTAELTGLADQQGQEEYAAQLRTSLKDYLRPVRTSLDEVSMTLGLLEGVDVTFADRVREYRSFIDQRVLWLRSGPPIWSVGADGIRASLDAVAAIVLDPLEWSAVRRQLESGAVWAVLGLGVAAVLFLLRPLLRRWLERLGDEVTRGRSDRFLLTIEALVATVMMAIPVPAVMVGLGLALRPNESGTPLVGALGSSLLSVSLWVTLLLFARRLVRRQGLAADHFGWRKDQLELVRRVSVRLFRWTTPFVLVAVFLARLPESSGARAIGGLLFIPSELMLAWAGWVLFSPTRGLYAAHIAQHPGGWLSRLRWVWIPLVVGVPVWASILTLFGWGYTSGVLVGKLVQCAMLGLGAAVFEGIMLRALEFAARAFARRSRAQVVAAPSLPEGSEAVRKEAVKDEIAELSRQARTSIRAGVIAILVVGLLLIWSELLPALHMLEEVRLWNGAHSVVTLASLVWALMIAAIAMIAAANLPGALEVLVLQHTGLSPGARYAATAVMRYGIAIAAVMMIGDRLGLSWSSVQWLVAAIGVGLGFGLQEIVGNFVAGLILLFEQPVRIGDVVTVGDRTGRIVRIRMRATTIRDGDGKDLIIPNKSLVTDRVVNWTLSGQPLRISIPVGVTRGTDLALAERLLRDAAASIPDILRTPAPSAQLHGFGPSSIDFDLSAFVARVDQMGATRHALTLAIQSAFSDAGIAIALPQVDVHVDPAALERLVKEVQR